MTPSMAELAVRWQHLAERQRDHLLFLRGRYRTYDAAGLEVLISRAERNLAGWAALAAAGKSGGDVQGACEDRRCDEPTLAKLDSRCPPARLAAGPQEAAAALECRTDGQPRHRWPAFLYIQPQPNPPSFHPGGLKDFADAVREAQAFNSDAEPFGDPTRIAESDDDAGLLLATKAAALEAAVGGAPHAEVDRNLLRVDGLAPPSRRLPPNTLARRSVLRNVFERD